MTKRILWFAVFIVICVAAIIAQLESVPAPAQGEFIQVTSGDRVCQSDGARWETSLGGIAFIIVTSGSCDACQATKPFGAELFDYAHMHNIPLYYVLSKSSKSDREAFDLRRQGRRVVREDPMIFGLVDVPVFMRIDRNGTIQSMWTGSVRVAEHDDVLKSVEMGSSLDAVPNLARADFVKLSTSDKVQVLVFSELGSSHRTNEKIIPINQLAIRARYELNPNDTIAVDCRSLLTPLQCQHSTMVLKKEGFKVVTTGMARRVSACP